MSTFVFAAHPDDEVLGAGGTISRLCRSGEEVHLHILGEGGTSRTTSLGDDDLESLETDARRAAAILGVSSLNFHSLPDNRFDSVDLLDVIQIVESVLSGMKCERVLTHSIGDLNIDHRITAQAVLTATRPTSYSSPAEVLSFEVLSSSEWSFGAFGGFEPHCFIEISETDLQSKVSALREYQTELRDAPHPRSVDGVVALARHRGSAIGVTYAEAFVVVRAITRLGMSL